MHEAPESLPAWEGGIEDDCVLRVGDLRAHVECLGEFEAQADGEKWKSNCWDVSVYRVDAEEMTVEVYFHNAELGGMICDGETARGVAEAIIRALRGSAAKESGPLNGDPMLKWFAFAHLPERLQAVSRPFHDLAMELVGRTAPGSERSMAMRKLLEAKDAAVRATVHPGG